jgi:hypothetical protein
MHGEPSVMATPSPSRSVKIDTELWKKIKVIVTERGINIQDFINDALRPVVAREYPKSLKHLNETEEGDK